MSIETQDTLRNAVPLALVLVWVAILLFSIHQASALWRHVRGKRNRRRWRFFAPR